MNMGWTWFIEEVLVQSLTPWCRERACPSHESWAGRRSKCDCGCKQDEEEGQKRDLKQREEQLDQSEKYKWTWVSLSKLPKQQLFQHSVKTHRWFGWTHSTFSSDHVSSASNCLHRHSEDTRNTMRACDPPFSFLSLIALMFNAHSPTAVSASLCICTCDRPTRHIDISTVSVISCSCCNCMTKFSYAKRLPSKWLQFETGFQHLWHHCIFLQRPWDNFGQCLQEPKQVSKAKTWSFSSKTQCCHNWVFSWLTQEQHLSHGCSNCCTAQVIGLHLIIHDGQPMFIYIENQTIKM